MGNVVSEFIKPLKYSNLIYRVLFQQNRLLSWFCIILSIFITFISLLQPLYLSKIIDIYESLPEDSFSIIIWKTIGLFVFAKFLGECRWFLIAKIEAHSILKTRRHYISAILDKSPHFMERKSAGEISSIVSRVGGAIAEISRSIFLLVFPLIMQIIMLLVLIANSFQYQYFLVLSVGLLGYFIAIFYGTMCLNKKNRENLKTDNGVHSNILEILLKHLVIKAYKCSAYVLETLGVKLEQSYTKNIDAISMRGKIGLIYAAILSITVGSIIYISASELYNKEISAGQFLLINTYIIQLLTPLGTLNKFYQGFKAAILSLEQCDEAINDFQDIKYGTEKLALNKVSVEFKSVFFNYPVQDRPVFNDLNFKIDFGSTVGIVGESGSGKSTIIKLLTRSYDADSGLVMINNIPIQNISYDSLSTSLGFVFQNNIVFDDTLLNNLRLGDTAITYDEIENAVKCSMLSNFIQSTPEKYDSKVGMFFNNQLSEGQVQRVSIARGLLINRPVLVMDEPTSALDNNTGESIIPNILALRQGLTTIIISHKLSFVSKLDKIIVVNKGRVIESGTHDELIKLKGEYYSLWIAEMA